MATRIPKSQANGTNNTWSTATNWVGDTAPTAGDDVILTGDKVFDGSDQSATALNSVTARNYTGTLGSEDAYLQLGLDAASRVELDLQAVCYLDFGDASGADPFIINRTATVLDPASGLYLKGTGVVADLYGGQVCLVSGSGSAGLHNRGVVLRQLPGHTATNVFGVGRAFLYGGVTNLYARGEECDCYSDATVALMVAENGARVRYLGDAAVTTITVDGGGVVDGSQNNETLTVTNLNITSGGQLIPGRNWTIPQPATHPLLLTTP